MDCISCIIFGRVTGYKSLFLVAHSVTDLFVSGRGGGGWGTTTTMVVIAVGPIPTRGWGGGD